MKGVKVLGQREPVLAQAQRARLRLRWRQGHQSSHRSAGARNDDLIAGSSLVDQTGEVGLGLADVDGLHNNLFLNVVSCVLLSPFCKSDASAWTNAGPVHANGIDSGICHQNHT